MSTYNDFTQEIRKRSIDLVLAEDHNEINRLVRCFFTELESGMWKNRFTEEKIFENFSKDLGQKLIDLRVAKQDQVTEKIKHQVGGLNETGNLSKP